MDQAITTSRRITFGFVLGVVCAAFGFWLRDRAIRQASEATTNFDLTRVFDNASSMARNAEVGLFLIVIGGLFLLMTFWRWLR